MKKQSNISPSFQFIQVLQQASKYIQQNQFKLCIEYIEQFTNISEQHLKSNKVPSLYQEVQLLSIKAYAHSMNKQLQEGLQILENCIQKIPTNLGCHKRKASILQKIGNIQQCKKQYQYCLLLQPESRSLKHKLKRLNMKSLNSSSCQGWSSDSRQSSFKEEKSVQIEKQEKTEKNGVKFGNFQYFDITTQDSDQRFAIIKEEINKLSSKKPKKSILKQPMSASVFKQKDYSIIKQQLQAAAYSQQKIEDIPPLATQQFVSLQKIDGKKKKKTKSVSFNEINNDFQ